MEHLLSAWPEIVDKLKTARHILLLSDYDGTLTPIVDRPERAVLSTDMWRLLKSLASERRLTVGILSGRSLADVKQKVAIPGIIYAGNHGLEIDGPGISFINPLAEEIRPILHVLHRLLSLSLRTIRGVIVEDKGLTLSVHYRMVERRETENVRAGFERVVGGLQASGKIRTTRGKEVLEIRPAVTWDKGKAIRLLMKRYGKGGRRSGVLPIYLGDDLTDEDGFRFIESYGNGISVFVGEKKGDTAARYFLKSPDEVGVFLRLLLELSQRGFEPAAQASINDAAVKNGGLLHLRQLE